jgi:hypothetical protein
MREERHAMRVGKTVLMLVVVVLFASLSNGEEQTVKPVAQDSPAKPAEPAAQDPAGKLKEALAENEALRAKLAEAVAANGALAARLKQLDPAFAAAVNKAEGKTAEGKTPTNTNTTVKTEVKLLDLGLLSPREESKPAPATGGGTTTDVKTEVKLIDLNVLSPSTNEQVKSLQTTVQVLSNRIAQQDAEIARLTTKLAKHGINPAPE